MDPSQHVATDTSLPSTSSFLRLRTSFAFYPIFLRIFFAMTLNLARIPSSKGFKIFLNPESSISLKGRPFIVTNSKHEFFSVFSFIFT